MLLSLPILITMAITLFTPGPNNTMLFSSGFNAGPLNSQGAMAGVVTGFFTVLLLAGLGIAAILKSSPNLDMTLKVCGLAFMLYLSYKIAVSGSREGETTARKRSFGFKETFVFQFINPKGLTMAFLVQSNFFPQGYVFADVFRISLVYASIGVFSSQTYIFAGVLVKNKTRGSISEGKVNLLLGIVLGITSVVLFAQNFRAGFLGPV